MLAFPDVAGMNRLESGSDTMIEVVARDGRRYRLAQSFRAPAQDGGTSPASFEAFVPALAFAMERGGHGRPGIREGLSFWNKPAGLAAQIVMLLVSIVFAAAAV